MPQSLRERLAAVAVPPAPQAPLRDRLAAVATPPAPATVPVPAPTGGRGAPPVRTPEVARRGGPATRAVVPAPEVDTYGNVLGAANQIVETIQKPLTMAKDAIAGMSDEAAATVGRIATAGVPGLNLLTSMPGPAAKAGTAEATRRSLDVAASMFLDPTNIPFLLASGAPPTVVRPAIRIAADGLMVAIQQAGAFNDLNEYRKTKDPALLESAAMQQAFALIGLAGVARDRKVDIAREAAKRPEVRTEPEIKSDLGRMSLAKQRLGEALSKPETVAPLRERIAALAKEKPTDVTAPADAPVVDAPVLTPDEPIVKLPEPTPTPAPEAPVERESTLATMREDLEALRQPKAHLDPDSTPEQLDVWLKKFRKAIDAHAPELRALADEADEALEFGELDAFRKLTEDGRSVLRKVYGRRLAADTAARHAAKSEAEGDLETATAFMDSLAKNSPDAVPEAMTLKEKYAKEFQTPESATTEVAPEAPPITPVAETTVVAPDAPAVTPEVPAEKVAAPEEPAAPAEPDLTPILKRRLIEDGAQSEMLAWAESVRVVQEGRQSRGTSAMSMESNVYGKEIEEAIDAEIGRVGRSLGAKENSPLAKFDESPGKLADAIEKGRGKLFDRIKAAFEEDYEKTRSDSIDNFLAQADTADDISFDFGENAPAGREGERGAVKIGAIARPLHNIRQAIFEAAERFGEQGLSKAGEAIGLVYDKLAPESVKGVLGDAFGSRPEQYRQARRELRGEAAELREKVEKIGDDLIKALPSPNARRLAAKLATNKATASEVAAAASHPEIMAAAQMVKNEFMRLGEAMIMEGVGKFAKLSPADRKVMVDMAKGVKKMKDLGANPADLTDFKGIAKYFGEYLPRLYRSKEAQAVLKKYGLSMNRVRQEFSRLKERDENLSEAVRRAMGEIVEIVEPAVKGMYQEEMMLAKNRFFIKIANDPSLTATDPAKAPASWRKLPDSELLGPLSGKTVEPSVYRDMTELANAPAEAGKIFATVQRLSSTFNRLIKKGKTVYNPATQVRNYVSNVVSRDAIGGMDATTQAYRDTQAFNAIVKKDARFKEARHYGLFDTDYAGLETSKIEMQPVMTAPKRGISGAVDVGARIFEALGKVDDAATWAYRMGDDVPKMGMYLWLRDVKGMSPQAAVKRTLDVLPDYSEVMPIVEKARRSLIGPTFVSYVSIQPARFARSILKHPVRAGKYVVIGSLVGQMLVNRGLKTQEELDVEQKEMPAYMKPKAGVVAPFAPLPFKDAYGRSLYLDLTYSLPFGDVMEGSGLFGLPPVFDIGILPRTLLDVGQNYNNFGSYIRNEPVEIYSNTDSNSAKTQKVAAYMGAQLLPSLTPGVGYGARRLSSAAQRKPSYYGDAPQSPGLAVAQVLGGFKTVAVDADAEAAARVRELNRKIADIDGRIRSAARNQSLSDAERDKLIDTLVGDKERAIQKYETR